MIPSLPFQLNERSKQVLSNISWISVDRILRILVGVLVGAWLARYLGPTQFGLYNYLLAYVALFASLANLGLTSIAIREIIKEPEAKEEILGVAFTLRFIAGVLALSAALVGTSSLGMSDPATFWMVAVVAVSIVFQAFDTIDYWFQAQVKAKFTVYAKSGAFLSFAAIKVAFIVTQAPLAAFVWAGSAELALAAIFMVVAYGKDGQRYRAWRWNTQRAKLLLQDSWPLIMSSLVIFLYTRIDQIMLAKMIGEKEAGLYAAAVRLAEMVAFLPQAVYDSVFPNVVNAKRISEEFFHQRLQQLYNVVVLISYICLLPVAVLAYWIVTLVYGETYAAAAPMLTYLALASIFTNLGVARSAYTTTMNLTKLHSLTLILGCVGNIALNFVLIPPLGGVGAALASLVAYWFVAHGACFMFPKLFRTGRMLTRAMVFPKVWGSQ